MSTAHSEALLPVSPIETDKPRHLRALERPARRRRPSLVYGLTAVIGILLIGAAQLGLSIATTQTTYDIVTLTDQKRDLTLQSQVLYDEVAGLTSPQYLASNATSLGMVVGGSPSYLRLSDGALIGTGTTTAATTVNANGTAIKNALIADTPLVTEPSATIDGETVKEKPKPAATKPAAPALPPSITDGLPAPETH